jgi:tetratricopeptide (TPR) repeat protein
MRTVNQRESDYRRAHATRATAVRRALLFLLCIVAAACGGQDPDTRHPDWEQNFDKARHASNAGQHDLAIATADAYLKRYPDNVDGLLMLGDARREAAKAASDASRPAGFEQAAKHYQRALELTHNPTWRLLSLVALVQISDKEGLNKPQEAMGYARQLITNEPKNVNSYSTLLHLHKQAHQYDEAASLLAEAKSAMDATEDAAVTYGGMVHDLVAFAPDFPPSTGRRMIVETNEFMDQALKKYGRTERLLRVKGSLLRAQAGVETDAARQKALTDESEKTFAEMDRVAR